MGEVEGANHPGNIANLVNQAEIDKGDGWKEEQKTGEFQQIKSDMEKFRKGLYKRNGSPGMPKEARPIVQMTYNAATALTEATRALFESPSEVAQMPVNRDNLAMGQKLGGARWRFMVNLAEALEEVNITPRELEEVRAKIIEIDTHSSKKDLYKNEDD